MVRTFQLTKALADALGAREHEARRHRTSAARTSGVGLLPARSWRTQDDEIEAKADRAARPGSSSTQARTTTPASLSGGQRKLLEMARALMSRPDAGHARRADGRREPGADAVAARPHPATCSDEGMTVLFVEHDMDMVRHITDWVIVMAEGRVIAEGPPDVGHDGPGRDRRLPRQPPGHRPRTSSPGRDRPPQRLRTDDSLTRPARARPLVVDVRDLIAGYLPGVNILNGCSTSSPARASSSASSARTAPASRRCSRRSSAWCRSAAGEITAERRGHHRAAGQQAGRPGRRLRAAEQQRLPDADHRGEPARWALFQHPKAYRRAARVRDRDLPRAGEAAQAARRLAVRRRAPDGRDGARADDGPARAAARRAVGRPVAGAPGRGVHPRVRRSTRPA